MNEHPLDRPVWSSLSSVHRDFSVGSQCARRFQSDIGPFAAIADESEQSIKELDSLLECAGMLAVPQATAFPCPRNGSIKAQRPAFQMVYEGSTPGDDNNVLIDSLDHSDSASMYSLAKLTNPGPFERRTHELGQFWGIKQDGHLAAMAGERFKSPGYVEISAVCTAPDFESRGYGKALCLHLCRSIRLIGCQPILHVFEDNPRAIKLYEFLGFSVRTKILLTVLEHKGQSAGG